MRSQNFESLLVDFFRREQTKCSTLAAWAANILFIGIDVQMFNFSIFFFREKNFVREKNEDSYEILGNRYYFFNHGIFKIN
jgi:hypothetical protein